MSMGYALRCDGSQAVDLAAVDTRGDGDISKEAGKVELERAGRRSSASSRSCYSRPGPTRC